MASGASHTACRSFVKTRCVYRGSGFSQQAVHCLWRPSERQCGSRHHSPVTAREAGDNTYTARPPASLNSETIVSGAVLSLLSSSSGAPSSGGPLVTALSRLSSEGSPNEMQQKSSSSGSSPCTSGRLQVNCRPCGKGKSQWSSTPISGAMISAGDGELEAGVTGKSQDADGVDQPTRRASASELVDHDSATASCDSGSAHSGTAVGIRVTSGASQELHWRCGTQAAAESDLSEPTETSCTASSPAGQSFTSPVPRLLKKPEPPWKPDPSDCCGSGCDPCIFDIYYQQLEEYHRLLKLWEDQQGHENSPPGSDLEST
ncbi:oxidoreductase- amine-terminal protein [Cystoisospora suis]|uniref:Oxidoreductase-amine-terminal protein n=1 Tax=Cystoisospora suis TaxID=483139 RepID=A0A2C6L1U1_9APIC|nr:oxidoreductase- amine-terminal protein [Cystoisospora suis]